MWLYCLSLHQGDQKKKKNVHANESVHRLRQIPGGAGGWTVSALSSTAGDSTPNRSGAGVAGSGGRGCAPRVLSVWFFGFESVSDCNLVFSSFHLTPFCTNVCCRCCK